MMQRALIVFGLLLALAVANWAIHSREALLRDGEVLLLELAPVDPRSLMQGDYMALDFRLANAVRLAAPEGRPEDGYAILRRDTHSVGRLERVQASPWPRGEDELALRYRVRGWQVRIVTNAWFFEEGQGARFEAATYGELRVADDGTALLAGLRNGDYEPIH
jgi:uncharacterized membrane-anchored protein